MTELKSHILRYWESEFSILRPRKNRAGNRAYTERDIKIIKLLKKLLYEDKFTIEGAQRKLKEEKSLLENQLSLPLVQQKTEDITADIRNEITELMKLVEEL